MKTLENKIWAILFILVGFISVSIENDISFLIFTLTIGLPLFFAKEKWIS